LSTLPIADFLAGALLTLLLPVALLIALVVWYWMFSSRVPDLADGPDSSSTPAAATPGPDIPETLPPEPGAQ
jgi:hypothetical protein